MEMESLRRELESIVDDSMEETDSDEVFEDAEGDPQPSTSRGDVDNEENDGQASNNVEAEDKDDSVYIKTKKARVQKKFCKVITRLGLKKLPDVNRVTIKKVGNLLFVIEKPEVYKNPSTDSYVVFGDIKLENLSQKAQISAAEDLQSSNIFKSKNDADDMANGEGNMKSSIHTIEEEDDGNDEEVNTDGIEDKDIQLVMAQAITTRRKAIEALRKHDNDIINAILSLTDC